MKYVIRILALLVFVLSGSQLFADYLSNQLRLAAVKNGYRTPSEVNFLFDDDKADLGEIFFNSEELSLNGNTSCSSCHLDKFSSADGIPNAIGVGGEGEGFHRLSGVGALVPRNTLPLWGRASTDFATFFWDGKVEKANGSIKSQFGSDAPSDDALTVAIHLPFLEIREMVVDNDFVNQTLKTETVNSALDLQTILFERVKSELKLGSKLKTAFSVDYDEISFLHIAESIKHFFAKKFALRPSRFSEFIEMKIELSEREVKGGLTFYGKGMCSACHSGAHFTDFDYHTILLPQVGPGKNGFGSDYGRFNFTLDFEDFNKFRTPPLHNVVKTSPYGHSGSVFNLKSAIRGHYDPLALYDFSKMSDLQRRELYQRAVSISGSQPVPSALSEEEINELIEFLGALSF